jgi:hypothetical protein
VEKEEDLYLSKEYKIVDTFDEPVGKWVAAYGNSFFIDSKFIL